MIKLTNLEKIYRTKEIETVALENVNLDTVVCYKKDGERHWFLDDYDEK